MNKILLFRKTMAERGIEITPEEAKDLYKSAKKIIKAAKNMTMEDIMRMSETELEGMSKEDKDKLIMLYQHAKEIQ
jgi:hypothetical protein